MQYTLLRPVDRPYLYDMPISEEWSSKRVQESGREPVVRKRFGARCFMANFFAQLNQQKEGSLLPKDVTIQYSPLRTKFGYYFHISLINFVRIDKNGMSDSVTEQRSCSSFFISILRPVSLFWLWNKLKKRVRVWGSVLYIEKIEIIGPLFLFNAVRSLIHSSKLVFESNCRCCCRPTYGRKNINPNAPLQQRNQIFYYGYVVHTR